MFYGRDDLVAELTDLVVNDRHIALIGTGGMGKSSLAKAILNEPLVVKKFAERRFFVTYDDLDPSTITFDAFIAHFASKIGIGRVGADPMRQISTFLSSTTALIVLDNAETFEEASGSSALHRIPPAIAGIADIPGIILILTSRSRRSAPNVPWVMKDIPPLDISSGLEAFFQIYNQASRSNSEKDITQLLKELEFHPLSINLLATAAQQNSWTPQILLKRWKVQPSAILDQGEGKLRSLSATMQLSLSSPSIRKLGKKGRRALAVVAYLPQGLNDNLAKDLLPSIRDITTICDVLCRHSLVYRQGTFIKMLAPIRRYVQNSSPLISTCLRDIRTFYYHAVRQCSWKRDSHADIIASDHLNIEHVIVFDLRQIPKGTKQTWDVCRQFLWYLRCHLPRPTALAPAIFNTIDNRSTCAPKAECLMHLGELYDTLSQLTEATSAFRAAEALYLTSSDHESVAYCVIQRANWYRYKGHHIQAQVMLDELQHSASWMYLSETVKAEVGCTRGNARIRTFTTSADELFSRFMEDHMPWGFLSKVWHWRAKLYYGEDIVLVKMHLEELLQQSTDSGILSFYTETRRGLAEVAFYQGRLSETLDILQEMGVMCEGRFTENVIWSVVRKAVIASLLGDYDLARELIHKTSESFEFLSLPSAHAFLNRSYGSAQVELIAGEFDKAEYHFNATIEGCDIQGNLYYKAVSMRGLGEVALARGNFALASHHFAETQSLCTEMGVPPPKLYGCEPLYTLPERFEGWVSFLNGRPPFTISIQ